MRELLLGAVAAYVLLGLIFFAWAWLVQALRDDPDPGPLRFSVPEFSLNYIGVWVIWPVIILLQFFHWARPRELDEENRPAPPSKDDGKPTAPKGSRGMATTPLRMTGEVEIAGRRFQAQALGRPISSGATIEVMGRGVGGLRVREAENVAADSTAPNDERMATSSVLLVISGPAGSGKTTLCENLLAARPSLQRVVTATSRAPREGESDGVDYHFLSTEDFCRRISHGDFYEWAEVHGKGRYYGSLKSEIDGKLASGSDLLLNIDVQGAATFRRQRAQLPGLLVTVFIRPLSLEQLRQRLAERDQDSPAEIERRLETARREIERAPEFDHIIDSGTKEEDLAAVLAIYEAARDNH